MIILRSAVLLLVFVSSVSAEWHHASADIMGTRITVELWHRDKAVAERSMAAVLAEMRAVDRAMSPYIASSEVSRLNDKAAGEPIVVSAELFSLIAKSLYFSKISGGAFDISFASVGRLYDYRAAVAPADTSRLNHLPAINYQLIELNDADRTIRFNHPQLKIDLGGIAKGYAVDRSIALLEQQGIRSAYVSAGGDSRILGDRRGDPWVIGIRHPRKEGEYAVKIPLVDTAMSTSGDYERYYMDGEIRVHHILNPDTGKSATQVQSVSILAPLAVDSDALSTTVFVLGVEDGLQLVNRIDGIEAVIIDGAGRLHYSQGLLRAAGASREAPQ